MVVLLSCLEHNAMWHHHACRDELIKLGLANMLTKLEEAAGHDKNLLRYIQRAQLKLGTVAALGGQAAPAGAHH